ncbi:hypothetical protein JVT61DRAFT_7911 [Boletus reticuloceps]|uniref:Uncharacterized protein n=1 Tax=Boletus reticuloceps TaxID=495285 RepID=A0A8I2YHJ8_9AGAM|nr:hypothetical protein JVT61DRAFT_7911 [Boletus reticuloceps]
MTKHVQFAIEGEGPSDPNRILLSASVAGEAWLRQGHPRDSPKRVKGKQRAGDFNRIIISQKTGQTDGQNANRRTNDMGFGGIRAPSLPPPESNIQEHSPGSSTDTLSPEISLTTALPGYVLSSKAKALLDGSPPAINTTVSFPSTEGDIEMNEAQEDPPYQHPVLERDACQRRIWQLANWSRDRDQVTAEEVEGFKAAVARAGVTLMDAQQGVLEEAVMWLDAMQRVHHELCPPKDPYIEQRVTFPLQSCMESSMDVFVKAAEKRILLQALDRLE